MILAVWLWPALLPGASAALGFGSSDPLLGPSLGIKTNSTAASPSSLSSYVPDDKYKLRIGDKVSLQILEDRDLPTSLVVTDSGELNVPYIGRMKAMEKTSKQLAAEIKVQLEKEYYYRATVVIALDEANKFLGKIYVWGQVRNQGAVDFNINEELTVGNAILKAGGFGDFANKKKVQVVRPAKAGEPKQIFNVNMEAVLKEGKAEKDMRLQPNDSVYVSPKAFNM
jgi:protein involved in polysaccharide export with SLBB domain